MRAGRNSARVRIHLTTNRVHNETCLLQTPPLPARRDPLCGVAVFPFYAQPARRRGAARPARRFGQAFASNLRRARPAPTGRWHLDEMMVKVGGKRMWLWRAVDDEGEVLDVLLQKRRNKRTALKLLRKLLKHTAMYISAEK